MSKEQEKANYRAMRDSLEEQAFWTNLIQERRFDLLNELAFLGEIFADVYIGESDVKRQVLCYPKQNVIRLLNEIIKNPKLLEAKE